MTGSVTDLDPALSILHDAGAPVASDRRAPGAGSAAERLADLQPANVIDDPLADVAPDFTDSVPEVDDEFEPSAATFGGADGEELRGPGPNRRDSPGGTGAVRFTPSVPAATAVPDIPAPELSRRSAGFGLRWPKVPVSLPTLSWRNPRRRTLIGCAIVALIIVVAGIGGARPSTSAPPRARTQLVPVPDRSPAVDAAANAPRSARRLGRAKRPAMPRRARFRARGRVRAGSAVKTVVVSRPAARWAAAARHPSARPSSATSPSEFRP
jgi:hypothetical protein